MYLYSLQIKGDSNKTKTKNSGLYFHGIPADILGALKCLVQSQVDE
jgi:hypothetical protein